VKLTFGGWTAKPANVEKTISELNALKIDKNDILVIDSMANAAFMGTNDDGLPIPATKAASDGRYHLEGDLQAAPNGVFKNAAKEVAKMIEAAGGARTFLLTPLPRYVSAPCCGNSTHVSNRESDEFVSEQIRAKSRFAEAIALGSIADRVEIIDYIHELGQDDLPLQEIHTEDGNIIWAGDGVHLTAAACRAAAMIILQKIENSVSEIESGEPEPKRRRLDSVIPVVAAATPRPPPIAVQPRPVAAPSWLVGELPRRGGGQSARGGWSRGGRGDQRGGRGGGNRRFFGRGRGRGRW
ncbi:MAG: hypothetical protein WCO71_12310, partial [Pseudomonadota bacterium]